MKYMLIACWLISALAWGSAPEKWWIGNVEVTFVEAPQGGLINPSCLKQSNCLALSALNSKTTDAVVGKGGTHPASEVCRQKHKGKIVIAQNGDETQSFCRFTDGSYASLDGLIK